MSDYASPHVPTAGATDADALLASSSPASPRRIRDDTMRYVEMYELTPDELLGDLTDVHRRNAPERLYLAGDLRILHRGPRISVVGSRKASSAGLRRARQVTESIMRCGMVVVSGLAEGIDTVAHSTAVAGNHPTMAVLGTPLDRFYPAKNRELQLRMMREQLVVSQFPPGRNVGRKAFVMRNRTMALLTDATVIVEAGERSGTRHQGWEALRLGRSLFIMHSVAEDPRLSWPREMVRYGAQVLTPDMLRDALEEIPHVTSADELTFCGARLIVHPAEGTVRHIPDHVSIETALREEIRRVG